MRIVSLVCVAGLFHRLRAFVARFGDQAGDVAGAAGGAVERLVEQAGEALEALLDVLGLVSSEETSVSIAARRSPKVSSVRRLLWSISATASASERPCCSNVAGELAEVGQHLAGDGVERGDVLVDLVARHAAALGHLVHGGDELGDAGDQRVLDRAHVLVRAAQHLLQEDVGLAQPLEQRGGVGAQHAVRFQHLGDRGRSRSCFDCSIAARVFSCRSLRVRLTALVAVSLASLTRRAICSLLSIMVRVKVKPWASIDLPRDRSPC